MLYANLLFLQNIILANTFFFPFRFDCGPGGKGISRSVCESRGCCYSPPHSKGEITQETNETRVPLGTPYCFYPNGFSLYKFLNVTHEHEAVSVFYVQQFHSAYPDQDVKLLKMRVEVINQDTLRIKVNLPTPTMTR